MLKVSKNIYNHDKIIVNLSIVLFFGSLWGIVEASLGYFLHKISFGYGWFIWFPLAFYFMHNIYNKTNKAQYMLYGAITASAIKLINLFIEVRVDKVINPSVSIILESVTLFAIYKILEKKHLKLNFTAVTLVNLIWRGLYAIYILLMPSSFFMISPLSNLDSFLKFILLESIVNALTITAYLMVREPLQKNISQKKSIDFSIKFVPSLAMFVIALLVQWIL